MSNSKQRSQELGANPQPTKHFKNWTRSEFEALPYIDSEETRFDSMVILPTRQMHDSGFRCMDFIAIRDRIPVGRMSGCSDVIHVGGIGGFGYNWLEKYGTCPDRVEPVSWSIDCLPTSGLLHIFSGTRNLIAGGAYSSFELFSGDRPRRAATPEDGSAA